MKRFLIISLIVSAVISAQAKSIWKDKNIYSSSENIQIGDLLIVNIRDISNLRFNIDMTNRTSSGVTTEPDVTLTGFLPKVSSTKRMNNNDSTQMSARNNMALNVAARVVNKNGNMYTIAGTRTYSFSGVTNIITVNGIIDPASIKGRNVDSNDMADFRLEIRGTKEGLNLRRDRLKEGEQAKLELTEQEKQDIILDYLQKMIKELTK